MVYDDLVEIVSGYQGNSRLMFYDSIRAGYESITVVVMIMTCFTCYESVIKIDVLQYVTGQFVQIICINYKIYTLFTFKETKEENW